MKCGICKAEMEEKNVTYTEDIDQVVIVIRHVQAHVCTECGNTKKDVCLKRMGALKSLVKIPHI